MTANDILKMYPNIIKHQDVSLEELEHIVLYIIEEAELHKHKEFVEKINHLRELQIYKYHSNDYLDLLWTNLNDDDDIYPAAENELNLNWLKGYKYTREFLDECKERRANGVLERSGS